MAILLPRAGPHWRNSALSRRRLGLRSVCLIGLFGATDGLPHHYTIVSNGAERVLGSKEVGVVVNPGDHIICLSSGGDGHGRLEDRDKEALTWDLKNGYVTG